MSGEGRRVEMALGAIHHGRSVGVNEPLILRASEPGTFELRWTLYAKAGRRHCRDALEVVVPVPPERPPFGKLHGIESFPDVPFVDEDGDEVRAARTSDPQLGPPAVETDDLIARVRGSHDRRSWLALGLTAKEVVSSDDDGAAQSGPSTHGQQQSV